MSNNSSLVTNTTGNETTPRPIEEELILAGYFLTMLLGALVSVFGSVAFCRRYKHGTASDIFFYHILLLEMIVNIFVVNSRAYIIMYGSIAEESCQVLTLTELAVTCATLYTLMINTINNNYMTTHPHHGGLFGSSKTGHFLCAFLLLWIWSVALIALPPQTPLQIEYLGYDYQCLWKTGAGDSTWYYVLLCTSIAGLGLPTIVTLSVTCKLCYHSHWTNNTVSPLPLKNIDPKPRNENMWVKAPDKEKSRSPCIAGIALHTIFSSIGYTTLTILLILDSETKMAPNIYNYVLIGARASAVAGVYVHIFCDKELRKELSVGIKCSD